MSGSRSGPLGSIRRRSDARSGTRGGVERRSSAATGGGGEAAGEGHARDVVAVQPRLRARVLELDRGPARHEGRVPERAVVRHRQRRDEEREERRRHGDGERGAGHLERRTDPRTRRGRGGRARARKRLLRARGDVRGEVRERGRGNSSPAFGGSPTERRPPLVVQTNSRSSSRAALVRPPRLTSAVIKLRAGNAPTSSPPRRAPLGPARTRRPRTFARDAEPPLAQPDAAFGERGALPRRRVRPLSLSTLPLSPSRAAPPRLTEPSRPFIRTTDSAAAASSRAARRGCYPLESCAPR